jgi:hypothetical protein
LARFAVSFAVSFARRLFFSRLDCYPNAIDQGLECLVMDQQRRSNVPMIISTAGYIPEEIRAHIYDGIPGVTASRTSDSPRRRRKTLARDPMGREIGSYEEEDAVVHEAYADHRPGFRTTVTAADHARVAESYNQMVAGPSDPVDEPGAKGCARCRCSARDGGCTATGRCQRGRI